MKDMELISGIFIDLEIPKEKLYLIYYFPSEMQMAFLRYFMVFNEALNFTNHTGYYCTKYNLSRLVYRYRYIIEIHDKAKKELTEEGMDLVYKIETGKYKIRELPLYKQHY